MKNRILYLLIAIIIISGIIVTCITGFNVGLIYSNNKQIDIYISKEFENNDVKNIVKEVIGNDKDVLIQKVELYEDMVSITVKDLSEEQKEQINQKINEKYELENKAEDITIISNANVKLMDIIKPYIFSISIASILVLIYAAIRFMKLGMFKVVLRILGINILAQALYFSIISITRIQFNRLTIPCSILLAIMTIIIIFFNLENKNDRKIEETKNNK